MLLSFDYLGGYVAFTNSTATDGNNNLGFAESNYLLMGSRLDIGQQTRYLPLKGILDNHEEYCINGCILIGHGNPALVAALSYPPNRGGFDSGGMIYHLQDEVLRNSGAPHTEVK
ncbi:hypothetical protein ETB97_009713 [Aspergillus alliaceus]|uniref:Uncharacterized protein n=1 Tax=Petromyces alliaceus TaxID=209559 RepID=A0A8H6A9K3_PETAA|nr:hypothetical protein ETB97_009713 [Aspergillus burnettii]